MNLSSKFVKTINNTGFYYNIKEISNSEISFSLCTYKTRNIITTILKICKNYILHLNLRNLKIHLTKKKLILKYLILKFSKFYFNFILRFFQFCTIRITINRHTYIKNFSRGVNIFACNLSVYKFECTCFLVRAKRNDPFTR